MLDAVAQACIAIDGERSDAAASIEITGTGGGLGSRLPVEAAAVACVASALHAATRLAEQRAGTRPRVAVDRDHVAAAVRSERFFDGGAGAHRGFAPLSRFWPAADGWVRTHANYPWHHDALLASLAVDEDAAVGGAIARLPAEEVQERVVAAGGVAAAVRSLDAWAEHPQGDAVGREPLVGHGLVGDARARRRAPSALPAAGVRVLDLTRVIAGPVCTRYLAALGAEVVRLDPPGHPDMARGALADTLLGKSSALLDAGTDDGRRILHRLLDDADVVVCGYRPGSLDRFGLSPEALAERHPGVVAVYLSAWGHTGPWAGRRGFDSVVQAPTGVSAAEAATDGAPGALPCQLLDHGTGYLAAAAALDGLRRQSEEGGTHVRRVSLARTAAWLLSLTPPEDASVAPAGADSDHDRWMVELTDGRRRGRAVAPPGRLDGRPLSWPSFTTYGDDAPRWPAKR